MLKTQLSIILNICSDYKINISKEQMIFLSRIPHYKISDALNIFYAAPTANKKYIVETILNKEFMSSSMYLKLIYYVANYDPENIKEFLNIINCHRITKMPGFENLIDLYFEVTNSNTYMKKNSDESMLLLVDDRKDFFDILPENISARIKKIYTKFISEYDLVHFEDTELKDDLLKHINTEFLIYSPEEKIPAEKLILKRKAKIVKYNKIG